MPSWVGSTRSQTPASSDVMTAEADAEAIPALRLLPGRGRGKKQRGRTSIGEVPSAHLVDPLAEEPIISANHLPAPGQETFAAGRQETSAKDKAPFFASQANRAGSGTGTGAGATGGTTAFFQVAAQGRSIVYVIDRSASMGPNGGLAAARRELLASMEQLPAAARFQVVVYNRSAAVLPIGGKTDLVPATPDNKHQAALLLQNIVAEGGTNHAPALALALHLQPDDIFFLTDADDLTEEQVRIATGINIRQNNGRTCIHAIELNTDNRAREDMPLHILAGSNHGTYQAVSLTDLSQSP
jgi:hypothetical protein